MKNEKFRSELTLMEINGLLLLCIRYVYTYTYIYVQIKNQKHRSDLSLISRVLCVCAPPRSFVTLNRNCARGT